MSVIDFNILLLVISALFSAVELILDAVVLETDVPTGPYFCPGMKVVFRCTTKFSHILDWSSMEYINDQIEFPSITIPGTITDGGVGNYSYGKFISSTPSEDGGFPILESELHIIVSKNFSTVSVKCLSRDNGSTEGVRLPVLISNLKVSSGVVVYQDKMIVTVAPIDAQEFKHFTIKVYSRELRWERNTTETETEILLKELSVQTSKYVVRVTAVNDCGEQFDGVPLTVTVKGQADEESTSEKRALYIVVGVLSLLVVICIIGAFIIGCYEMARCRDARANRSWIKNGGNIVCCSQYHDKHQSNTPGSKDGESHQESMAEENKVQTESTV